MRRTPARWPLWVALALLALACAFVLADFARRTDAGRIIYCLDDAYIHMAIAKNLAAHGTFGVSPHAFSFSSSSPLWIAILWLCFAVLGPVEIVPLALNLVAAVAVLVVAARILRVHGASPWLQLGVLVVLVFHVPLIPNLFSGMEHTLHMVVSLVFLSTAAVALVEPNPRSDRWLLFLAPVLAAVRYEGLFLVGVVCVLLACRGRLRRALILAALAAAPPACLGLWSLSQGGPFLPSPLLLKGAQPAAGLPGIVAFAGRGFEQLAENRWIGRLVVVCIVLWMLRFRSGHRWDHVQIWLLAFVGSAYLHAQFAAWGWFYRYEAYLVAMGTMGVGMALIGWRRALRATTRRKRWLAGAAFAGMLVYVGDGLLGRCYDAVHRTPKAMRNIFEQQYQMGLFLRSFAPEARLFANDIGAIHFLAEPRSVDLVGLANHDIVLARRRGDVDARIQALVARRELGDVAVIYAHRFGHYFQNPAWIEVGRWTISDNVVCDDPTVVWLARDEAAAAALRLELSRFEPELPPGVVSAHPPKPDRPTARSAPTP